MSQERFRETAHFHGDGLFGYAYTSTSRPRLSYKETCYRKDRSTVRVWQADGQDCASRDAAEAALLLPPVLTPEESAAAAQLTEEWMGRYARAMAHADDEDLMEWEREYGRRARAAMKVADAEIAEALAHDAADRPSSFDAWPSAELAAQCRMQARDTGAWDTEDAKKYEAFMLAVAKRLAGETSPSPKPPTLAAAT